MKYLMAALLGLFSSLSVYAQEEPLPVKVVVVTMFEIGTDDDNIAGEFQLWKERRNLTEVFPFGGYHDLYYDREDQLLVMVTGIGTAKSAASVMMLGMDPRFDVSKAYWLVAGIAGIDPEDGSIGSAAWATYVVDGDLSHEIDAREIPEDWPFGYFARYTSKPFDPNKPEPTGEMFALNAELTEWAYQLTKDTEIPDLPGLKETRELYTEHPKAQLPPFVLKGDHLAALTFWHGAMLNDWANQWVDYWTEGKGEFVTSAMEETGTMQSLTFLGNIGRADPERVLVLRTASNYTMQPPGLTAAENLLKENDGYAGLEASVEAAYLVGSKVVDALIAGWDVYSERLPTTADLK